MLISILFLKKNATFRDYDCDPRVVSWILFIKFHGEEWVNSHGESGSWRRNGSPRNLLIWMFDALPLRDPWGCCSRLAGWYSEVASRLKGLSQTDFQCWLLLETWPLYLTAPSLKDCPSCQCRWRLLFSFWCRSSEDAPSSALGGIVVLPVRSRWWPAGDGLACSGFRLWVVRSDAYLGGKENFR